MTKLWGGPSLEECHPERAVLSKVVHVKGLHTVLENIMLEIFAPVHTGIGTIRTFCAVIMAFL
jgi:hypothetical protein